VGWSEVKKLNNTGAATASSRNLKANNRFGTLNYMNELTHRAYEDSIHYIQA